MDLEKKEYISPEMRIRLISFADIIVTSGDEGNVVDVGGGEAGGKGEGDLPDPNA